MRESIKGEEIDKSELLKIIQKRIEAAIETTTEKISKEDSEEMKAYYTGKRQGYRDAKRIVELVSEERIYGGK